ncbi:aliphatic sulfonate ABC transporter substrate-binding protein [Pelomonas aquatica]|jgi:sulfonate transport system substrate-binding protein|uniref:Putative aliphatic sulfonates-binding protein n=1 Tax=Pelomonas aquatica TaxID=431058 RepID=A0A9X4R3S3_9BURK|nr:aliphatic sulfonate ABC transporter substrate-binding protein [Pelomonas aquatica]MCY4753280.1 aliphatic sulfonate ABC transporter substrate-binding protein [Pelomonas aquatica]MDG0861359.1 aliphatic sulfonate ABC transporter substrate-binding protein [Pelomonas aquatica]
MSTTRRAAVAILATTAAAWRHALGQSPAVLRIGFQKGSLNLALLKSYGLLEQRLPSTRIQWTEFPAGPQLLEALALGSVDLGATGDAPPVFAQAAGKDVVYVGAEPPKPDSSALLVKPDSPLKTLADLRGRRIALQRGSSAHFLTVQAVKRAGLGWADIQPVYLPPADARAAFERGSVDAWAVWDPYYAAAEISGELRTLATSRGLTNNNTFYLASRALAQQPALVKTIFQALTDIDARARADRRDAVQRYAEFAGLPPATVLRMVERRGAAPVGPLTPALVNDQQQVADAFAELGLIPRPIRVADAVAQVKKA